VVGELAEPEPVIEAEELSVGATGLEFVTVMVAGGALEEVEEDLELEVPEDVPGEVLDEVLATETKYS
jgi:hypothetical protein